MVCCTGPGCLETRPPDVAAPVCAWHARAPGMGPVGLPWPGSGFDQSAGTEVHPLWGPGADKSRFCGPGDRLPGRPRRWRVLLHDEICPSAVSIALSGVPARNNGMLY